MGGGIGSGGNAGDRLIELQRLIAALEAPLIQALDELTNQITKSSFSAAIEIESAQSDVADAIRRGVQGAGDFQAALDNTARQLVEANAQLTAAQNITDDPDRREVEVRRAEDRVRDVGGRLDAINERAREIRLGRTFGGERTTAALSGLGLRATVEWWRAQSREETKPLGVNSPCTAFLFRFCPQSCFSFLINLITCCRSCGRSCPVLSMGYSPRFLRQSRSALNSRSAQC